MLWPSLRQYYLDQVKHGSLIRSGGLQISSPFASGAHVRLVRSASGLHEMLFSTHHNEL